MDKYLSIGKAAKMLGVTPKPSRRWEFAKIIRSERTPTGYRRFRSDEVLRLLTKRDPGFGTRCVIYARVSSAKQSHDGNLDRQRERLLVETQQRGYDPVLVVAEQASGINDKRRDLWRVLRLAEKRGFDVLLIECPDRLARFGYRYLAEYLRAFDVRVEIVQDQPSPSFEEELTRDLITILRCSPPGSMAEGARDCAKKITETIHEHTQMNEGELHGRGHEDDQAGRP